MYNPFTDIFNQILPEPQASLLNGILFGIKTRLPEYFYDSLITTGTIHMVALSGQNISILVNLISQVTLPLGRKPGVIVTFFCIFGFVWFVGFSPSLVRAAIMGSMGLFASILGRKNWSLYSLFFAALIMLLLNPIWFWDISFHLSFLASLGIILFNKNYQGKSKSIIEVTMREIKSSLRMTLSAQIFTLPLIFIVFRQISLISPISNLLTGWTIPIIMILGIIVGVSGWIYLPVGQIAAFIVWPLLTYFVFLVELLAKIPFAAIKF